MDLELDLFALTSGSFSLEPLRGREASKSGRKTALPRDFGPSQARETFELPRGKSAANSATGFVVGGAGLRTTGAATRAVD